MALGTYMLEFEDNLGCERENWTILVLLLGPDLGRLMTQIQDSPLGMPSGISMLVLGDVRYPPHPTTYNVSICNIQCINSNLHFYSKTHNQFHFQIHDAFVTFICFTITVTFFY